LPVEPVAVAELVRQLELSGLIDRRLPKAGIINFCESQNLRFALRAKVDTARMAALTAIKAISW